MEKLTLAGELLSERIGDSCKTFCTERFKLTADFLLREIPQLIFESFELIYAQ